MALTTGPDEELTTTFLLEQQEKDRQHRAELEAISKRHHQAYMAMAEVCRQLGRLKTGPRKSDRSDWIEKVLRLADEARAALAVMKGQ